ncbi:hypothetical protein Pint_15129 [Pistacia integerrima]|uniref:Uncharacterized protein n=1 Tax=Pistacia integerrima TaxID=434235 RepID=A0ACC0ZFL4_9ROSI|nr:hypothetical protein Pint_15129 [Pistacia integerrima]
MIGHDSMYFSTTKKGEIPELKEELNSQYKPLKSTTPKKEDGDYLNGTDAGYSDTPTHVVDGGASPQTSSRSAPYPAGRQPAPPPTAPAPAAPVPDLLSAPLLVLLPASTGQGLQISAQLTHQDGQVLYSMLFENNTRIPLDGFVIQLNKNTFGLVVVPQLQAGTSARTFLPMVLFQNMSAGAPSSICRLL